MTQWNGPAVTPLLIGLATAFDLIAAIGAQNAFVLRQGIRNELLLPVVILCAASDLVLIAAGVAGVQFSDSITASRLSSTSSTKSRPGPSYSDQAPGPQPPGAARR